MARVLDRNSLVEQLLKVVDPAIRFVLGKSPSSVCKIVRSSVLAHASFKSMSFEVVRVCDALLTSSLLIVDS